MKFVLRLTSSNAWHEKGDVQMSIFVDCPACNVPVKMKANSKMGETLSCTACKANLEVIWLDPIELDVLIDDDEMDVDDGIHDDFTDDPYEDYEYPAEVYDYDD